MTDSVTIYEMAPRDGLQNEKQPVATADKIKLVDLLSDTGLRKIEVTSFVNPKWVPQLADASKVMAGITRRPGITYAALTPNMRGFEDAQAAGATEVAVFASASEGFSRNNINCSIDESLNRFAPVVTAAQSAHITVRGYVSCVIDCPFDGPTDPAQVTRVAKALAEMGCYEVSLGDTLGHGTPETVARMLDAVLADVPARQLAGHFHDTGGTALANIDISLGRGLRTFDSSAGGLGGCPYAPGASGNVATEQVVARLHAQGFDTGIEMDALTTAARFAQTLRNSA